MFRGVVDRASHELGLLVTFSGSSPALGSIIVREEDGHYIGKVDSVLGSTESPLVHVAHLDRKQENNQFIGSTVTVRAKKEREDRPPRREFREERPSRDRERSFDRRDNNSRGRNDQERSDWLCASCGNDNFAFRTECNSCGKSKRGNVQERGSSFRNDRGGRRDDRGGRGRDDRRPRNQEQHNRNDWICPSCKNDNFSFRTECNQCGKPRPEELWEEIHVEATEEVATAADAMVDVEATEEVATAADAMGRGDVEATEEVATAADAMGRGGRGGDRRGGYSGGRDGDVADVEATEEVASVADAMETVADVEATEEVASVADAMVTVADVEATEEVAPVADAMVTVVDVEATEEVAPVADAMESVADVEMTVQTNSIERPVENDLAMLTIDHLRKSSHVDINDAMTMTTKVNI